MRKLFYLMAASGAIIMCALMCVLWFVLVPFMWSGTWIERGGWYWEGVLQSAIWEVRRG